MMVSHANSEGASLAVMRWGLHVGASRKNIMEVSRENGYVTLVNSTSCDIFPIHHYH